MAQLGCGELTPPANRYPTRMFKDEDSEGWRPYFTFKRRREAGATAAVITTNGAAGGGGGGDPAVAGAKDEDEWEWVEDQDSDEGAVWPIQGVWWDGMGELGVDLC